MLNEMVRFYRRALYASIAILLAMNVATLMNGRFIALIPLSVQCLVLSSVYLKKSWAILVVKVWASLLMVVGLLMWCAVALDGRSHFHSLLEGVVNTLAMIMGWYFFRYARCALINSSPTAL
jgi:hypothetical protein